MNTIAQQTFAVGSSYIMRSPCDYECTWTGTIVRRSAKSVWVSLNGGQPKRSAIRVRDGEETCRPLGASSMSPILGASKEI